MPHALSMQMNSQISYASLAPLSHLTSLTSLTLTRYGGRFDVSSCQALACLTQLEHLDLQVRLILAILKLDVCVLCVCVFPQGKGMYLQGKGIS